VCMQNVELTVVFTDFDGVDCRQTFRDIKLPAAGQVSCSRKCLFKQGLLMIVCCAASILSWSDG
jgi:hypothetical protein